MTIEESERAYPFDRLRIAAAIVASLGIAALLLLIPFIYALGVWHIGWMTAYMVYPLALLMLARWVFAAPRRAVLAGLVAIADLAIILAATIWDDFIVPTVLLIVPAIASTGAIGLAELLDRHHRDAGT